jgi:hypothetical protein
MEKNGFNDEWEAGGLYNKYELLQGILSENMSIFIADMGSFAGGAGGG